VCDMGTFQVRYIHGNAALSRSSFSSLDIWDPSMPVSDKRKGMSRVSILLQGDRVYIAWIAGNMSWQSIVPG